MSRLPISLRLTLTFALAMAVVLACAGAFVYLRMRDALDSGITTSLRTQLAQVTALARQADTGLSQGGRATVRSDSFAQVLTRHGQVIDTTPTLPPVPLLSASEVRRAASGPLVLERAASNGLPGPDRLLAAPVSAQGQRLIVVVGTSLAERNRALEALLYELLIGAPAALAAVALAGLLLARASLRPVERMRRETEHMTGVAPAERVTLPPAEDEIRRLGVTLNGLLDRVQRSVEQERRFAADASHELRTPLALLRTELELALRRPRSADDLTAALRSASVEADRLVELTERLLVLARWDCSTLTPKRRLVQVAPVIDRVADRFRQQTLRRGRELVVRARYGGRATVDASMLDQALTNLVENALRHGAGTITVELQRQGDALILEVLDQGLGFPDRYLPRAFERFSRADPARASGGAGLGLSIVQAVAVAHGWQVDVSNRPGGGACVALTIALDSGREAVDGRPAHASSTS